nr:major facilitator superfamily domain-containing protein 6-A-like [Rhipicephalus microplus]
MFLSIDRSLLPIKAHYFLYVAAQACVLPYLAAVGRSNGIPESNIAYVFTFIPFGAIFVKVVCGYIADKTQNVTAILLVLVLSLFVSDGMVFFSKSVQEPAAPPLVRLSCPLTKVTLDNPFVNCTELLPPCNVDSCTHNASTEADVVLYGNVSVVSPASVCSLLQPNVTTVHRALPFEVCRLNCSCFEGGYNAVNYAIYAIFVAISFMTGATVFVLSDAAVCEKLGDRANCFGKQRMWGTISWGILSPIAGVAIDAANTATNGRSKYTPGFYIFATLIIMDMIVLHWTPRLRMGTRSSSFFKDLKTVFGGCEFIVFTVWTCLTGVFFGVQATYNTWFLEDIGAPKLVIGLGFAIMTLLAELPLLFVADKILARIGYFSSYCLSFASSAIKLIAYSFLTNPWHALFIDVIGGAAFPLAFASMTVFARENALQGVSASVLCALNACFEGVGVVTGNLIGGICFEKFGGKLTYQYLSVAASLCVVGCALSGFVVRKLRPRDSLSKPPFYESTGA